MRAFIMWICVTIVLTSFVAAVFNPDKLWVFGLLLVLMIASFFAIACYTVVLTWTEGTKRDAVVCILVALAGSSLLELAWWNAGSSLGHLFSILVRTPVIAGWMAAILQVGKHWPRQQPLRTVLPAE